MNVLEAFLHDPLVEWRKKPASSANRNMSSHARKAMLAGGVALSQKHSRAARTHQGAGDSINENAQRIIHRIGQRLKGLYQRKLDLLLHDPEFARQAARMRNRMRAQSSNSSNSSTSTSSSTSKKNASLDGSAESFLANRLPLSIEGQV